MNDEPKRLYPWVPVDECVKEIVPGLPKTPPATRVYRADKEWVPMTQEEFKALAEHLKAESPKPVRTAAQIASNVVAKRRARKKAAKEARRRNRR